MTTVFKRPESLKDTETHYCSGCGHGIVHRLIAEVVDELGIRERVVGIAPVGCAVLAYEYFNFDVSEAAHGRAPAVATGMKRARPDLIVFAYQGDGDLAAIGMAEIIHAANRGEHITVFFVNNAVYGMTGGQMAPTTMLGQKTETTPRGRNALGEGAPIRVAELLAQFDGVKFVERCTVSKPRNVLKARAAVKTALSLQIEGKGFGFVEILSPCPTYWGLQPRVAMRMIEERMEEIFPLGRIKEPAAEG
ncbi:MAG: thiamine pyrophosphate-dependent enzyme [bacterium]|nr:thiamine pyrophosphate-dependent enzyme [bacterium]